MSKLFKEFPDVSSAKWKEKIITELKEKDFQSLIAEDGTQPFYHGDNTKQNTPIEGKDTWISCQLIDATNAKKANKEALSALENEAGALCFSNPNNLQVLLKDISIEHIRIDFKNYNTDFVTQWSSFITNKNEQGIKATKKTRGIL